MTDVPSMKRGADAEPVALSLVVPAFNEAKRIGASLPVFQAYLETKGRAELIVVDDGSTDGTADVVREGARGSPVPVRVFRCGVNRGKGHALKVGFAASRGECVMFTDADLSTPIEEGDRLLERIAAGAAVAIGSRKLARSRIDVRQPWLRERMGMAFTALVRLLICDVSDATCGLKAMRGDVGRDLFARARLHDWSFDAEILFLAHFLGHEIAEVPVRWEDRAGTKVRLLRDAVSSFVGLLRIRANAAAGRYAWRSHAYPAEELPALVESGP